ncbi:histidine kinase [Kaistia geumhonensis]|uniref:Histidine kinase n=1 Tax=Kaistia geumhonensis TaxID=410839 RepID=A0ABU0M545_9HYPH|nr:histidine kinase [Kaistia geumhonensis]MCX5478734.1 histidine kinase [Kaistia geumhonensis]MDQ0516048.1 hypothetical protein [Kaistia geumhonensis]
MAMLAKELEKAEASAKAREESQHKLQDFTEDFLRHTVTESEIAMVRRVVATAVSEGKLEALVYSFPSSLCSDGGRAINNAEPDWPETLQGKAREFYDRYEKFGRPQGYHLKAMVINFPGGIPGDIGLFLNWAPPVK